MVLQWSVRITDGSATSSIENVGGDVNVTMAPATSASARDRFLHGESDGRAASTATDVRWVCVVQDDASGRIE